MTTIDIGGKPRPFLFGWGAINMICKKRELTIQGFGKLLISISENQVGPDVIFDLMYAGFYQGAKGDVDFNESDMPGWLDESDAVSVVQTVLIEVAISSAGKKKQKEQTQQESTSQTLSDSPQEQA